MYTLSYTLNEWLVKESLDSNLTGLAQGISASNRRVGLGNQ